MSRAYKGLKQWKIINLPAQQVVTVVYQGVLLMRVSFHRALTGKILGVLDRWSFMGVDAQERWSPM